MNPRKEGACSPECKKKNKKLGEVSGFSTSAGAGAAGRGWQGGWPRCPLLEEQVTPAQTAAVPSPPHALSALAVCKGAGFPEKLPGRQAGTVL